MKKFLNYFLILMIVPLLVLNSCKDDTTEPAVQNGTYADLKSYMLTSDLDLPALLVDWVIAPKMEADGGIVAADYTIPGYHVFDIRGADDFNAGHIEGSMNVPFADVLSTAVDYKDKPILVVCYSGQTAGRAVMALRLSGYPDAQVMKFGFSYWSSDSYDVSGAEKSFDKWSPKISDVAVGSTNWTTDAAATLPVYGTPTWESSSTDGATILAERVDAMLGMDWIVSSTDVLAAPTDYSIYNFWSSEDYLAFGHYKGAYQIKPISLENDITLAFNPAVENLVYCYTGQTSSFTTAWLQVLGYPTKSIGYGVNSLSHAALDEAGKPAWHHSMEYSYEVTN